MLGYSNPVNTVSNVTIVGTFSTCESYEEWGYFDKRGYLTRSRKATRKHVDTQSAQNKDKTKQK